MNIKNIINGVNCKDIANINIDSDNYSAKRIYSNKNIIFCKTDYLPILFSELNNHLSKNILITQLSDFSINETIFNSRPSCIIKWFASNPTFQHPDLIPLPLGIENHEGTCKGASIDVDFLQKYEPAYNSIVKNTVQIYCNFREDTHFTRPHVKKFLLENKLGIWESRKIAADYYKRLSDFLFVASPRGNGIDCHRTWETLLMGSIPIVQRHFMYDTFTTLPIIQINNWEDLSDDKILDYWRNKYNLENLFINMKELTMEFWFERIKKEFNEL